MNRKPKLRPNFKRQRGVAVITALLLTTLAVTIVASLFWQQQVQVRSMENQRLHLQTKWILRGALDWARLVLRQDGFDNKSYTTLNAVWNTPLAETRLDQYIERERVEGEVFDATLSGKVIDATSRYNLKNLADGRVPKREHIVVYQRLLQSLQLDPVLAERTAIAVAAGAPPQPVSPGGPPRAAEATAPIEFKRIEDLLSVPGYSPEAVAKLRDFVIVLPVQTKVNVNTAPAEVLAALIEGYTVSDANALVARRKQAYFRQESDFTGQLFGKTALPDSYDVKSEYFLVQSQIRLDRAALDAEALVKRTLDDFVTTTVVSIKQN